MSGMILPYGKMLPKVADSAFVAPNATLIGDVEIGSQSSIWFQCVLRGDVNDIRVGKRTNIQDGTIVHVAAQTHGCYIGDDITIGHLALIHACTLENGCFIGMKATVMDFAVVEAGAMVAAGALVPPGKVVKSGQLWAGTPARMVRQLSEKDLAIMAVGAPHYVELAETYRVQMADGASP